MSAHALDSRLTSICCHLENGDFANILPGLCVSFGKFKGKYTRSEDKKG